MLCARIVWRSPAEPAANAEVRCRRRGRKLGRSGGEGVVATTYLNVIPNLTRSASPYAVIENVVVDQALRETGLGKQIMADTLQAAWDAGCYKAMLQTGSRRPTTHSFYRACGFSPDEKAAYLARPS
ncbi:GNAT family N-acetyltransferase [Streptomyces parvus]|uniref:GNAT family N-acetyltransferase n=1 Tax=Streptomyces parvus TaxID=66428 RepID=UPI0035E0DC61